MRRTITRTIGEAEVSIITDGAVTFTPDLFPGTQPETIAELLSDAGAAEIETNFNAVLIRHSGRVILADAGPRDLFGPSCGFLAEGLAELSVAPDQVDTLVATHLHPDHVAGMITPDGAAVFSNATLYVTDADRAFWSDDTNFNGALSGVADWAKLAQSVLAAYGDRLETLNDGHEAVAGLSGMALPGHTPGHFGWRLDSGGESLLHVGDIVHAPALQVANPEIAISFDIDMDQARDTRKRLLDQLASDGTLFTGGHFLQPAFNRVQRAAGGYRLEPGRG
ncbi:MBL fold metallo-hydrolase [Roseinatronobacter bogoriensis]|uniref:MBL fold metallo-hydrolase n=1 Tax=Roseinatronobacter bogoriensis subsp. barguzinensis TaxID=441209 RepID=A0A2K8KG07_9RHOB|nr:MULTISPECIES: MBL fold metallo-hydrolase [Rhodobaca]ATX65100.1 MBL fold metallo-hydrolase [Rhodobaca barguzinensis]MBB4209586.1 glyoxylase-like metal-dependent hydrolase (beta-lactamase superfamily II) [Rhodobaca bogoriensis DSM 18756]TDW35423.1 glyoxylase-like metal-dependent hydrolase (beta-lactamase superfamily II) [Rhodobaca barguzinensis]TDY66633.1 glyoxylase-like metal-dependent hydrolase (beta-lactamase superfamily II) [Rhodobaca bogoriensis DSM 18756]